MGKKKRNINIWFCYLLQCGDGTYYCGITNNLARRINEHKKGKGAKYTRGRGPFLLIAVRGKMTRGGAATFERMVKSKPRNKKVEFFKTFGIAKN